MKIIESSIIGKKSPEACEDGMVVTDDFIAVMMAVRARRRSISILI